jgi:rRNA-processing protein EBP2
LTGQGGGFVANCNFQVALERILDTIQLDPSLPWTETLTVSYPETIDADVDDDLKRELALYVKSLIVFDSYH